MLSLSLPLLAVRLGLERPFLALLLWTHPLTAANKECTETSAKKRA